MNQSYFTSKDVPSSKSFKVGLNSTMKSHTDKRQSISLFHKAFFSGLRGSNLKFWPNTVAAEDQRDVILEHNHISSAFNLL